MLSTIFFPSFLQKGQKPVEESIKWEGIGLWRAGKSYPDTGSALGISKICGNSCAGSSKRVELYDKTQQSKIDEKVMVLQVIDSIAAMRQSRRNC